MNFSNQFPWVTFVSIPTVVSWLALGLVAGLIVHAVDPGETRGGVWAALLTGLIGALVGGIVSSGLFGVTITGFDLRSVAIAVGGALLLILLQRIVFRQTGQIKTQVTHIRQRRARQVR
jgi:uncharacterized membrane protein YeaQ/YmgE (transglycosylase-associated protein family)